MKSKRYNLIFASTLLFAVLFIISVFVILINAVRSKETVDIEYEDGLIFAEELVEGECEHILKYSPAHFFDTWMIYNDFHYVKCIRSDYSYCDKKGEYEKHHYEFLNIVEDTVSLYNGKRYHYVKYTCKDNCTGDRVVFAKNIEYVRCTAADAKNCLGNCAGAVKYIEDHTFRYVEE